MLTHPAYGGAYTYGKTESLVRYAQGESRSIRRLKPRDQWVALLPDAHEGYVSWEEFERIQQLIRENLPGSSGPGAAKAGLALISGLLRCARCGRKLTVRYTGNGHDVLRYSCHRGWLDNGEPRCIAFGGIPVDEAISKQIIRVVQPVAINAAVMASEEAARGRDDVIEALNRDLEAARYAAQRAQRQYDAADPENRLVTDELERRWNVALQRVRDIEDRIAGRASDVVPGPLASREQFAELATKLQQIWNDSSADIRLKKRIIRTLIQEVVADVNSEAGEVILVIHWKGGVHTELRVPRRRRGQSNAQTPKELVDVVTSLARIYSDELIAGMLNRNGLQTGRGNRWTKERVTSLRSHYRIRCYRSETRIDKDWVNLTQAASLLKNQPKDPPPGDRSRRNPG